MPEFQVGGLLNGKGFGDYNVLWRIPEQIGEHQVIRFYRFKGRGAQDFELAYHVSSEIVPGRRVLRRFVGPAQSGWRADTVDLETDEDLGLQGTAKPYLDVRDLEILAEWGIHVD